MLGEQLEELEVTGWRGLGAAQTTSVHCQGCKALSGILLEEDVGDSGLHTPPFLLPMQETCSGV